MSETFNDLPRGAVFQWERMADGPMGRMHASGGCHYVKTGRETYQLVRHWDHSPVPGMTYNLAERGTDGAIMRDR